MTRDRIVQVSWHPCEMIRLSGRVTDRCSASCSAGLRSTASCRQVGLQEWLDVGGAASPCGGLPGLPLNGRPAHRAPGPLSVFLDVGQAAGDVSTVEDPVIVDQLDDHAAA